MNKWGNTEDVKKRATDDAKLRAIGILFLEDMRDYIQFVLSTKDPHDWMELLMPVLERET